MAPFAFTRPFGAFRFVLALLVLAQHFLANAAPDAIASAAAPYEVGSVAVLAFFCLSGFVICEAAEVLYRGRPGAFIANRLLRIAPHFLAAIVVMVLMMACLSRIGPVRVSRTDFLDPALAFTPRNLAANALGFLPFANLAMREDFLVVALAVRVEMIFYVVVLAALWAERVGARRYPGRASFPTLLLAAAVGMLPLFLLSMLHKAPAFLQLAPYFTLGGALYFVQTRRGPAAGAVVAVSLALIAWEFAARPTHHPVAGFARAVGVQSILLAACLAAVAVLAFGRARHVPPLDRQLGDLSYPVYIWHDIALLAGLALGVEADFRYGVVCAAAALALAVLARRGIDPAIDRLRDAIRGSRLRHAPRSADPADAAAPPGGPSGSQGQGSPGQGLQGRGSRSRTLGRGRAEAGGA